MRSSRAAIEAFVEANDPDTLPERWRDSVRAAVTQRMERHEHLDAVAAALRECPARSPGAAWRRSSGSSVPTLVVGSRDDADPLHPLAVAEEYARRLPNAELIVEDEGQAPLAWQGGRLSEAIAGFLRGASIRTASRVTPSGATTSARSISGKLHAR